MWMSTPPCCHHMLQKFCQNMGKVAHVPILSNNLSLPISEADSLLLSSSQSLDGLHFA
jgi:hypothetical protein